MPPDFRSKKARRTRVLYSLAKAAWSVGAPCFQSSTTAELSSAPESPVPSNSGIATKRLPALAAARIASVCAVGNMVPAGRSRTVSGGWV